MSPALPDSIANDQRGVIRKRVPRRREAATGCALAYRARAGHDETAAAVLGQRPVQQQGLVPESYLRDKRSDPLHLAYLEVAVQAVWHKAQKHAILCRIVQCIDKLATDCNMNLSSLGARVQPHYLP